VHTGRDKLGAYRNPNKIPISGSPPAGQRPVALTAGAGLQRLSWPARDSGFQPRRRIPAAAALRRRV